MSRLISFFVAAGVLLGAPAALAQAEGRSYYSRGQGWSVLAGETVGHGHNAFVAQGGWPGVSLGLLHGASPRLDIGGRFSFNYGEQRIVEHVEPGVKFQAVLRLALVDDSRINVGVHFAPGPFFSFREGDTVVGMEFPVGFVVGIPVGSALMLNFGLDLPFFVAFGEFGGPALQVMPGAGFEYFLDRQLAFTFNVRMGPTVTDEDPGFNYFHEDDFALDALFGLSYRF